MTMETAAAFASIVGVVVGLAGLVFGLREYAIGQKWKRSELAAAVLQQLAADPQLALACQMLDYAERRMVVPEPFTAMTDDKTFVHNWETLRAGLRPESEVARFGWQETLYRDVFDHLFQYLERVNHYINIGLIDIQDVATLRYWLDQIRKPRFVTEPVFTKFIQVYEYHGVVQLLERFSTRT